MRDTFLVYGSETNFNSRACDLLRRDYKVIKYESLYVYNENGLLCVDPSLVDKLLSQIKLFKVRYFLFSSECLLFFNNDEDFFILLKLLDAIKFEYPDVKLLFAAFEFPNPLRLENGFYNNKLFKQHFEALKLFCIESNCLLFEYKTYFTHIESILQINPLGIVSDTVPVINGSHADDIVLQIIEAANSDASICTTVKEYDFNLVSYRDSKNLIYQNHKKVDENNIGSKEMILAHQKECAVEVLYRKEPGEKVNDKLIADIRMNMGIELFKEIPENITKKLELVVPVPETGKYYAQGFSLISKVPYVEAIFKRQDMGRSFDITDVNNRNSFITKKLGIYPELVSNKIVGIVDEAIFTGSTLKIVIHLLKAANVREIYLFIPSPPCKTQCKFNMQPDRSMLLSYVSIENLAGYFNVNGIYLQNVRKFQNIMVDSNHACINCFK